jgi:hypothetical protein
MKRIAVLLAVIGSSLSYNGVGYSQTSKELNELKREIGALKAGQIAIHKDILEIKNMLLQKELQAAREALQGKPVPAPAQAQAPAQAFPQIFMVSVADAPFKGEKLATLTLIDFTDYE